MHKFQEIPAGNFMTANSREFPNGNSRTEIPGGLALRIRESQSLSAKRYLKTLFQLGSHP